MFRFLGLIFWKKSEFYKLIDTLFFPCANAWLLDRTHHGHSVFCNSAAQLIFVVVDNKNSSQKTEQIQHLSMFEDGSF